MQRSTRAIAAACCSTARCRRACVKAYACVRACVLGVRVCLPLSIALCIMLRCWYHCCCCCRSHHTHTQGAVVGVNLGILDPSGKVRVLNRQRCASVLRRHLPRARARAHGHWHRVRVRMPPSTLMNAPRSTPHWPQGSFSGVGFAVPIDMVKGLVAQILQHGRVRRPSLGISLAPQQVRPRASGLRTRQSTRSSKHPGQAACVSCRCHSFPPQVLAQLGAEGVLVLEVPAGSPAAAAGLRATFRDVFGDLVVGDIIVRARREPSMRVPPAAARLFATCIACCKRARVPNRCLHATPLAAGWHGHAASPQHGRPDSCTRRAPAGRQGEATACMHARCHDCAHGMPAAASQPACMPPGALRRAARWQAAIDDGHAGRARAGQLRVMGARRQASSSRLW